MTFTSLIIHSSIIGFIILLCLLILVKIKLYKVVYIDPLTNLWNLKKFEKEVTREIKKNKNTIYVLSDTDIRDFKNIDKTKGSYNADILLCKFSELLNNLVKPYEGFVSRGYADHFYGFEKLKQGETPESYIDKIKMEYKQYDIYELYGFNIKQGFVFYNPSIETESVRNLLGKASYAKKFIPKNKNDSFIFFDETIKDKMKMELHIGENFHDSIKNNRFSVVYQPQINPLTQTIVGAEALVRWNDTKYGKIMPDSFIPTLEENGEIQKLDFFVYNEVCKFLNKRIANNLPVVPISLNMSKNHLDSVDFEKKFMEVLSKYSVPTRLIKLEILENACSYSPRIFKKIISRLYRLGINISLDDFGSGESSLGMLSEIPINEIKLDKLFMNHIGNSMDIERIITKVLELSHSLGITTICEGVETHEQNEFLKSSCCDIIQGFYYSKPLEENDFVAFMNQHL